MPIHAADDIVISDFTVPDYNPWQVTRTALGEGPVSGPEFDQPTLTNALGFAMAGSETGHADGKMGKVLVPTSLVISVVP